MFLGIDVGTSGVKAVVTAADGALVGQASAPLSILRPYDLWSEQDPDDWWQVVETAVATLDVDHRRQVRGIGLTGQMHGAVVLGADDRPLRPAILWNDGRSFAECAALEAAVPSSRAIVGNLAMPGFTAPKLMWLRTHEPTVFARVETVLLPKDYIRLCMTGDKASDLSDSAGTLWLDVAARDWSDAMLGACDLSRAHMPTLFEGCSVAGSLRPEIAARWGMACVPVAAGAGDNAAGAIGVGVIDEGDALLSLGTSGVIFAVTNSFRPKPERAVHAFCHCLPERWHQMSVHLSAASCIDWAAHLTNSDGPAAFMALAEAARAGTGAVLFMPYLSGERTPHNDPHVRAAFLGLDNDSDPGRIAAAVLEGVAFAHADGLNALREGGTAVEALRVIGGGARSRHWGHILAAALDVRLVYGEGAEVGPALGAARLARIAVTCAAPADVCRAPPTSHVIDPDPRLKERLALNQARFRRAYHALTTI
jgi:xylulokinase